MEGIKLRDLPAHSSCLTGRHLRTWVHQNAKQMLFVTGNEEASDVISKLQQWGTKKTTPWGMPGLLFTSCPGKKKKKERMTRCKEEILRMKHSLGSSYWRTSEVWCLNSSVVDLAVDVQQCWEPWSVVKGQMANTLLTPWWCYSWFTWGSLCLPRVYTKEKDRRKRGPRKEAFSSQL